MTPEQAAKTMQAMYDSEINCKIETFWDNGFEWHLGDYMNGWKASGLTRTFVEAVEELKAAVLEHYPLSGFARKNT